MFGRFVAVVLIGTFIYELWKKKKDDSWSTSSTNRTYTETRGPSKTCPVVSNSRIDYWVYSDSHESYTYNPPQTKRTETTAYKAIPVQRAAPVSSVLCSKTYTIVSAKSYLQQALWEIAADEQKQITRINSELRLAGPFLVTRLSTCTHVSFENDHVIVHMQRAELKLIEKEFGLGSALTASGPMGFSARVLSIDVAGQKLTASVHQNNIPSARYHIQFSFKEGISEKVLNNLELDAFFPPPPAPTTKFKVWGTLFKMNEIQKKAIFKAISTEPATNITPPHLIRGPPGTGKTTALVELIYQVVMDHEDPLIIVCTPSNRAADNVIERIPTDHVKALRLISLVESLKPSLTYVRGIDYYTKYYSGYDVVVCTIGMLKTFYSKSGFPTEIPTHVIIDEASMVADTDMILVLGLLRSDTKFIMFGDDKQLGPVVTVDNLRKSFLETSMFERLLNDKNHERASICLLENYRSCPGVVAPFNHLFYKGKLIAKVTPDNYPKIFQQLRLIHRTLMGHNSAVSPTGVYFRSVKGDCEMGKSMSWSNLKEAKEIVKIFNSLLDKGVPAAQIGIITPYTDQVNLIKDRIPHSSVVIGSVDSFQGQERNVILISTVRSFKSNGIGFVGDKKRLNVTLSRAKTGPCYCWKRHCVEEEPVV